MLKAIDYEPSGPFLLLHFSNLNWMKILCSNGGRTVKKVLLYHITTIFSNSSSFVHKHQKLLLSIASARGTESYSVKKTTIPGKPIASFTATTSESIPTCILCKKSKHTLNNCSKFKSFTHEKMMTTIKSNDLCINCLKPGHYLKQCKSLHKCHKCKKPHHTIVTYF